MWSESKNSSKKWKIVSISWLIDLILVQAAAGKPQYEEMAAIMRKEEKKLAVMIKKQEKVLFVAFHLLLNLAEDLQIERKMKNRQIIIQLLSMLERNNPDLLFIVLNFLKKLSIFGDNKIEMKD